MRFFVMDSTLLRWQPCRRISFILMSTLMACSTGCMARESQNGDSFVYTSTLLNSLLLMVIAGVILGFGVTFVYLGVKPEKGRNRNPTSHKVMALAGGIAAILIGAAISIIGVPYSFMAHITVHPDRVVMRDSVLWFASGDREIWYDSIVEFAREDKPIARRGRKKEDLVIRFASGPPDRIEMGPRERAAYAKLVQAHQQYRADNNSGAIAGGPPPSREVVRYLPPYCGTLDGYTTSDDVDLEPGDKCKICYEKQWQDITIVSRSQSREVEATWGSFAGRRTMLSTIDILIPEAVHEQRLEAARRATMSPERIAHEDATNKIKAQFEANRLAAQKKNAEFKAKYEAAREQALATANPSLPPRNSATDSVDQPSNTMTLGSEPAPSSPSAGTAPRPPRRQQAFVVPIEREWSDATGTFKITATYVDSKQGYVLLRKPGGEEISVPISKLSPTDRRIIAKLSRATK
jgi:hypothetical protein